MTKFDKVLAKLYELTGSHLEHDDILIEEPEIFRASSERYCIEDDCEKCKVINLLREVDPAFEEVMKSATQKILRDK